MIRSYTVRLKVTKRQDAALNALLAELCELYNAALQERRDAWKTCRERLTLYGQMRELTELRRLDPEEAAYPVMIQRDPLRRVDHAFNGFFRRKRGFPRFRSRDRYDSFTCDAQSFLVRQNVFVISKIGGFKFKTRFDLRGEPRTLHIVRHGKAWRAVVVCEVGPAPAKRPVKNAIGIDVGITSLATLSDGSEIGNPQWTKCEAERLAAANRSLARKMRRSNNWLKAKERLRRAHQRIKGMRRAYLHSVSAWLVERYDLIAFEDLRIGSMVRSSFAKSILDASWKELTWQIVYKAEEAGRWAVPVEARGTTQLCSGCGVKVPKDITQRQHQCSHCGLSLGRDHNAALNILRRGERLAGVFAERPE